MFALIPLCWLMFSPADTDPSIKLDVEEVLMQRPAPALKIHANTVAQ